MPYDLNQFDTYGLDFKTRRGKTYIRPQFNNPKTNKPYKRWAGINTQKAIDWMEYATAGDTTQLEFDREEEMIDRLLREAQRRHQQPRRVENVAHEIVYDGTQDGDELRELIMPFTEGGNRLILNIRLNGEWRRFDVAKVITEDTKRGEFFKMTNTLMEIQCDRDYHDGSDILIQIVILPQLNPELRGVREGIFNCAILPVILTVQQRKDSKRKQSTLTKLEQIQEQVKETGVDNALLQKVATLARVNICVYDLTGKVWHKFLSKVNCKTILLTVHNQHAVVRDNPLLQAQVDATQKKKTYTFTIAEPINFELFNEQEVKWVSQDELESKISENLDAHIISSKGNHVACITKDTIYKTEFEDHEKYPDQFTDGGVGKAKFLEQVPYMKNPNIDPILWEADISGFYMRTTNSHHTNTKFDMNHSYKSFRHSKCFKGFPTQIDAVFSFPQGTKASETECFAYNGLFYVEWETLTIEHCKEFKPIYYESSGWYPIEIVESLYLEETIDPVIKAVALSQDTFDFDENKMTNQQFRAFVGKVASKYVSDVWRTTDLREYLRALYQLQNQIVGIQSFENNVGKQIYHIEYTVPDKKPWQCPVISVYVKAHQKLQLFRKYNQLVSKKILPVYVSVDGIEIKKRQAKRATRLFESTHSLGTEEGQWKLEEIKPASYIKVGVIERPVIEPPCLENVPLFDSSQFLPKLTHISGPGGNGKTEFIVKLSNVYKNICYMAPTHDAGVELELRAKQLNVKFDYPVKTYHRVFGIGTKYEQIPNASMFVFDEASMIPEEHIEIFDTKLRERFNADKPFGGKQIVLSGDFWQLPPIKPLKPLYNNWTGEKSKLYSLFTEVELTKNWRQKSDPEFYNLCQALRKKLSLDEAKNIIETLNTRVAKSNKELMARTLDDMYIAGVNMQCDVVNKKKYGNKFLAGTKVICTKTITVQQNKVAKKIPNGKVGVVLENKKGSFIVHIPDLGNMKFRGVRQEFKHAYALTIHKSQGKTKKGKVVIDPSRLFEKNHLYVALTRATKFENIYLTAPITMRTFAKTVFVIGRTNLAKQNKPVRLIAMVKRYKKEEPNLSIKYLIDMREKQKNKCCYCNSHMGDTFGYDNSITLERISNDKPHILTNIKLCCFSCNSAGVGQTIITSLHTPLPVTRVDRKFGRIKTLRGKICSIS